MALMVNISTLDRGVIIGCGILVFSITEAGKYVSFRRVDIAILMGRPLVYPYVGGYVCICIKRLVLVYLGS